MFVIVASHHSTHLPLPALRSAPRRSPESLSGDLDVRYILMNLNLVRICSHTSDSHQLPSGIIDVGDVVLLMLSIYNSNLSCISK